MASFCTSLKRKFEDVSDSVHGSVHDSVHDSVHGSAPLKRQEVEVKVAPAAPAAPAPRGDGPCACCDGACACLAELPYQVWQSIDEVNRRDLNEAWSKLCVVNRLLGVAREKVVKAQAEEALLAAESARLWEAHDVAVRRLNAHNSLYELVVDFPESDEDCYVSASASDSE